MSQENEVQNLPMKPAQTFEVNMRKYQNTIAALLGSKYGISPEEFMVMAVNAVKKTPKLLDCDPKSLFASFLMAAECGLRPNAPDGCCYILPYGREAQFQLGYKGIIEMAYRNNRVKKISAEAVYENDFFEYEKGTEEKLIHKPLMIGDRGKLICVYAVCKMEGADPIIAVVLKNELDKIQKLSPGAGSKYSPYNSGVDIHNWMQIKAAVKKLLKTVPKNSVPEISRAIQADSAIEGGGKLSLNDLNEVEVIENKEPMANTEENKEAAQKATADLAEKMKGENKDA